MSEPKHRDEFGMTIDSNRLQAVTVGTEITYRLREIQQVLRQGSKFREARWFCYHDNATVKKLKCPDVVKGPRGQGEWTWDDFEMKYPGTHVIACQITAWDRTTYKPWREQHVQAYEAVRNARWREYKGKKLPYLEAELSTVDRYVDVLKKAAQDFGAAGSEDPRAKAFAFEDDPPGPPPWKSGLDKRREHDNQVRQLEKYVEKLLYRLETVGVSVRSTFPFYAQHRERKTGKTTDLRVALAFVGYGDAHPAYTYDSSTRTASPVDSGEPRDLAQWVIVDWTNPQYRYATGTYRGAAATHEEAIRNAIAAWNSGDDGNRYPKGTLEYDIPEDICGVPIADKFETDGKNFGDDIGAFFENVGMAAGILALVAGVVTAVAPMPGSRVVSGAIWTAVFTSAVAGTIAAAWNIGRRGKEGFGGTKADVLDCLTIVSNLLTLGQGAWVRGATLVFKSERAGLEMGRAVILGQVTADGITAILVSEDIIKQYEQILSDGVMSPTKKTNALLKLFGSAGLQGVGTATSVKGSARDFQAITKKMNRIDLDRLRKQSAEIEVADEIDIRGRTDENDDHRTVVDEQQAHNSEASRADTDSAQWHYGSNPRIDTKKTKLNPEQFHIYDVDGWEFKADCKDGVLTVNAQIKEPGTVKGDPDYRRSDVLFAHELYPRMYRHFEKAGNPVKSVTGLFVQDNYASALKRYEELKRAGKSDAEALDGAIRGAVTYKYHEAEGFSVVKDPDHWEGIGMHFELERP